MVRKTSIEAYAALIEGGLLGKLQTEVYKAVYKYGALTGNELIKIMNWNNKNTGSFNTRLSELRRKGLVEEIDKVECPVTGNRVILWDVTDRVIPLEQTETFQDKINKIDDKIASLIIQKETMLKKAQGSMF